MWLARLLAPSVLLGLLTAAGGAEAASPPAEGPAEAEETWGDLEDDMMWVSPEETPSVEPPAWLEAGAPRTIYLFYADGTAGPAPSYCAGKGTPSKFACEFGSSVEDCQKKIQVYLDKHYADFNVVFTITRPTGGTYYSMVVTNDGGWCGSSAFGIAPAGCGDMGQGTAYAFVCGGAQQCAGTISQEQAHMVGLLHTTSPKDLMYPTNAPSRIGFEDKDNMISGTNPCGGSTQNSYQLMKKRLGAWPGGDKPGPFGPSGGGGAGGSGGGAGGGAAGSGGSGGGAGAGGGGGGGGAAGGASGAGGGSGGGGAGGAAGSGGQTDGGPDGSAGAGGSGSRVTGGCAVGEARPWAGPTPLSLVLLAWLRAVRRRRSSRSTIGSRG